MGFTGGDYALTSEVINKLEVIHIYGQVGIYEHIKNDGLLNWGYGKWDASSCGVFFSAENKVSKQTRIAALAQQIFTINEQEGNPDFLAKIDDLLSAARQLYFIGMAYHPQNWKFLINANLDYNFRILLGTGYGLSEGLKRNITSEIYRNIKKHLIFLSRILYSI